MLHITSFMQSVSKLNNVSSHINHLNKKLNRNYSFVYDQNLDRYDFFYNNEDQDDYESVSQGYWGYLRDKKADRKLQLNKTNPVTNNHDGYWGIFQDIQLSNEHFKNEIKKTIESKKNVKFCFDSGSDVEQDSESVSSVDEEYFFASSFKSQTELNENPSAKLIYDVCSSKFKIEACKRDEMKILLQNLEDKESQLKKEILKSINNQNVQKNPSTTNLNCDVSDLANQTVQPKIKKINFLYFSNLSNKNLETSIYEATAIKETDSKTSLIKNSSFISLTNNDETSKKTNLANFKNAFNTLSKLNKSINIFNGNYLNIDRDYLDHFVSFFNVHASMNDLNDLLYNYTNGTNRVDQSRKTTTVSLCSNILETNLSNSKPFGWQNHSTMLFEHNNVKIGFMALVDRAIFDKLNHFLEKFNSNNKTPSTKIEYIDFVLEANRLSSQLKLSGAQIIICLTNFESEHDEQRLLSEACNLDIIFSSNCNTNSIDRLTYKKIDNRFLIKSSNNFESLSLITLCLDEFNSNKLLDIAITKYFVD